MTYSHACMRGSFRFRFSDCCPPSWKNKKSFLAINILYKLCAQRRGKKRNRNRKTRTPNDAPRERPASQRSNTSVLGVKNREIAKKNRDEGEKEKNILDIFCLLNGRVWIWILKKTFSPRRLCFFSLCGPKTVYLKLASLHARRMDSYATSLTDQSSFSSILNLSISF